MKPIQDRATMARLDFAAGLANGHRVLTVLLQPIAFFLQEDVRQHGQRPEMQERRGTHQLILVHTQFFLAIAEKHLNVEAVRRYTPARWLDRPPDGWKSNNGPARAVPARNAG